MKKIIMSWSKCKVEIGRTGSDDAMATTLTDVGVINDKSTTLATEDGETLTATATGGIVVAEEEGEPTVTLTYRIKEPSFAFEQMLTGAVENADGDLVVSTNIVEDDFSLKLTPKNIGAIGIKARRTHISYRPGSSEEEGHYVDVTHKILACEDGELYKKFRVKSSDWNGLTVSASSLYFGATASDKTVNVTATGTVTASANVDWLTVEVTAQAVKVSAKANAGTSARTGRVTISADGKTAVVSVTQIPS